MLIWLLLSCGDPQYGTLGDAIENYDRGRVELGAGNPAAAAEAFGRAMKADPKRSVLIAWHAHALRKAGDLEGALQSLNEGLVRFPHDVMIRYNRAAILARTGNLNGSAQDLRWLYANEGVHPIEVGEDSDFVALGTDSELVDLIPVAQVEASVKGEAGSVLLGESYTLEFTVTARNSAEIGITAVGDPVKHLALSRLVEDVLEEGDIWTRRTLRAEYIAVESGTVDAGPWLVSASGTSTITGRVGVEVVELPGRMSAPQVHPFELVVPSVAWGEVQEPVVREFGNERWAWLPAGSYIKPVSAAAGPRMEFREAGQPRWTAMQLATDVVVELRGGI